jgi:methionine-S-sulfoxide reductase
MKQLHFVCLLLLLTSSTLFAGGTSMHSTSTIDTATFAGGCFWCMQPPFDNLLGKGVISVQVGYTGGTTAKPTYEQVSTGSTGHAEAVQVVFDSSLVSYAELLDVFWHNIDPTTVNRQFADEGTQYRTAIFYHSEGQKQEALASKQNLDRQAKFSSPLVTSVEKAGPFYEAENYHQSYYTKNAAHYQRYKVGSGREGFLKKTWKNH